jgi:hypothetical protein
MRDLLARLDEAIAADALVEFSPAEAGVLRRELAGPRIALVGCGKEKLDRPAPARELYTGSLFRMAVAYAEAHCDGWFVLSAEHGLVASDQVLAPYDTRIEQVVPRSWGRRVAAQLVIAAPARATLVLLAGDAYGAFRTHTSLTLEEPLRGMGIGERRAWLSREVRRVA